MKTLSLFLLYSLCLSYYVSGDNFPPGWIPVQKLDTQTDWKGFREIKDKVHLYIPDETKPVNGIFACFVFHSGDPRELADLWNFAMVTVPWPFEYDLGHNDKRNGRYKLGHPTQDMGLLLRYLDHCAKELKRPELSTVPIVGWLGQNGSRMCGELYSIAPDRVLAWGDSFPNRLRKYPEMTKNVPFAFAWEISKKELRSGERVYRKDKGPHYDLSCRANTYGFGHGIYSKFNFFMFYIDRCIKLRMPDEMPEPGQPVKLKPAVRENGWIGDFDPISGWNPIATVASGKLKDARYPVWMPDSYAAHAWRAYHSSCTDLKITAPKVPYRQTRKGNEPEWGLGYGGFLQSGDTHTFSAMAKGPYTKVEFFDGDKKLGESTGAPWSINEIKIEKGLRVFYVVGTREDNTKSASIPAIVIVK